jgi:hypothetical protein
LTTEYDDAVARLYQAPHSEFVAERKRLGNELVKAGHKPEAALFAKLPRPSVSAWAVNQLFWRARPAFDAFLASAARLRAGALEAAAEHRKQSSALVNRAAELLKEAGNAAAEATLRRVSANLAAIAAAGGFDPDPPGAMKSDREPPGFDAFAAASSFTTPEKASAAPAAPSAKAGGTSGPETASTKAEAARTRAAIEAERRRVAEEQARVRAERRELETALRTAKTAVERRTKERDRLKGELERVEAELESALASERELAERLEKLPAD